GRRLLALSATPILLAVAAFITQWVFEETGRGWNLRGFMDKSKRSYDVSRDFSISANPDGVWAYGWKKTLAGRFVPYHFFRVVHSENGTPEQIWARFSNDGGNVERNGSTDTIAYGIGGQALYAPLEVVMVAGADGASDNFAVIRFTVPPGGGGPYRLRS